MKKLHKSNVTLTWIEDPADHAGEHDDEHGQQLQVATQDAAGLHMGQVLAGQAPLDNHLQEASVE